MPNSDSVFHPNTQDELAQFVVTNAASERRPLIPIGGGTTSRKGSAENAVEIHLDQLNRVIDFPARDMTITVEAGIRMADLAKILRAENQRLPIDIPQADQATLGGVIASNWSGPRRYGCGTMRDYVIGISAIDASGQQFKAGGRVVKNVAGYDLCKLLVGSHGTLAIITQVTLKLRPLPESSGFVCLGFDTAREIEPVIDQLQRSATRPIVIDVWNQNFIEGRTIQRTLSPMLYVGYEGSERETLWQIQTLLAECKQFAPRIQETILDSSVKPFLFALTNLSGFSLTKLSGQFANRFKTCLPSSRTMEILQHADPYSGFIVGSHAGNGIVFGHHAGDYRAEEAEALYRPLRELVRSHGGTLIFSDVPSDWKFAETTWADLGPAATWMQRVKQQLDPLNLLKPGCLPVS